jgi:hypothetical protein
MFSRKVWYNLQASVAIVAYIVAEGMQERTHVSYWHGINIIARVKGLVY